MAAPLRILRLGTSEDVPTHVPESALAYRIVEEQLCAETGEPVETVVKVIWPSEALLPAVERWLTTIQPDLVYMKVAAYWFAYESVPLKIERLLGRAGRPLSAVGLRAAAIPRVAHNAVFKAGRRLAQRTIGGATPFAPEEVVERMEACIRSVVRTEHVGLVVRGPQAFADFSANDAARERAEQRRQHVHRALRDLCRELHVEYVGFDEPLYRTESRPSLLADDVHRDAAGKLADAAQETAILLHVLRKLRQER